MWLRTDYKIGGINFNLSNYGKFKKKDCVSRIRKQKYLMATNNDFVGVDGLAWSCCESPDINGDKILFLFIFKMGSSQ